MVSDGVFRNVFVGGGYFYFTRMGLLSLSGDKSMLLYVFLVSHVAFDSIYVKMDERLVKKMMQYCGFKSRQQFYYCFRKLKDVGLAMKVSKNVYAINPKMFFYGSVSESKKAVLEYESLVFGDGAVFDEDAIDVVDPESYEYSEDYI